MSTQALSSTQLLSCSDTDFDSNIKNMAVKDLMGLISMLQKEMAKEQENFNGLSSALQGLKDRNSRQYKTISRDMMASQGRLTTLMNRSMKCFSMQNVQQNSQGVQLRRRNSSKTADMSNSSPAKSTSVQRSRSMYATSQPNDSDNTAPTPTTQPSSSTPTRAPVGYRGGVNRALNNRVETQQRPASVVGVVNGVASNSRGTAAAAAAVTGSRVSVGQASGVASSSSLSSLNLQPQAPVVGAGLIGQDEPRARSRSQVLITPSPASSQPVSASSPLPSSSLTHASSQPSVAASSQMQGPSAATQDKAFNGLPSVRQLAQTFGGKPSSGQNNPASTATTNYRPVIRAQSIAASDASRRPNFMNQSSSSSKVNGVPTMTGVGGRFQGQYVKRAVQKPPSSAAATTAANGQTELEKVHARMRASREINISPLPDKPAAASYSATQNGDKETTYFATNLDRKKSSSSIVLGQKTDFDDDDSLPSGGSASYSSQGLQLSKMRRAQSREELYVIESRARVQKDALMKEIGKRREDAPQENVPSSTTVSRQWGLKGSSMLAQRLQQDEKERAETVSNTQNGQGPARVSMQLQPSLPSGVGGGLAISIRSTSRENLAEAPPPHAQERSSLQTKASRSSPSSLVPSSASAQPPPASTSSPTDSRVGAAAATVTSTSAGGGDAAPHKSAPSQTAAAAPGEKEEFTDLEDENTPRMNLIDWDPRPLLDELYKVKLVEETAEDISHQYITMEGLMEKLPMNKKKSTLLKTWKRRFFRAKDGWVAYFETGNHDKASETLQLMGGRIDDMGNRILGIDDGRGHYLMVRAPTEKEYGQWKIALESQTADNSKATYVRPVLKSVPHPSKNVVVIDLGSSAIRAGVLGEHESLPQVFFPSVVAVDKETGKKVVGYEAYHPDVRKNSTLLHPIRPSNKVDQFNIEVDMMSAIFGKVFTELRVDPSQYMVMLSTPQTLSDPLRAGLMNALVEGLGVQGVCMVQQSLLALYSYRTTTGIIVDIGHRIEILPIYDGFVIESGVARCPYGSEKVIDSLKKSLLENNFKFASQVEMLLVRYIMEQCCYVAHDYKDEETLCSTQPGKLKRIINLCKFGLPEGAYRSVEVEEGRFSSPEGFFNVDLWEMDYPTLHKLIFQAIQSCPMDNRRHMYRAVYLSGGVTMLPGFQERLHAELKKLAPPAVTVEVHASPNRFHAAYLGACSVASMSQFKGMTISRDEWRREGARSFKKWQASAS